MNEPIKISTPAVRTGSLTAYGSVKARNVKTGNLYRQCFEETRLVDTSFSRGVCPLQPIYVGFV